MIFYIKYFADRVKYLFYNNMYLIAKEQFDFRICKLI